MFFNNDKNDDEVNDLVKIAALLIHAASIDENYTKQEENIIKQTLVEIGANKENLEKILNDAKVMEKNASQILDFTKKVKNMNHKNKIMIIESLWKIIYSNNDADMYETNLMRRLAGLLYIDSKTMGDIKDKIKNENF
tara:strand:- start:107 stop:520 length:414 start_codon:yes stop_codon:yes gene_type:complete